MELLFNLAVVFGFLAVFLLPLCLLAAICENTAIGRKATDWILTKMGVDISE